MRARPLLVILLLWLPATAQAQYFGKNKVQYKDMEWRVLETPHFEILYYEHEGEVVQNAARMAEAAYERLSATLGHSFGDRIPLILYASHADFQSTHITPSHIDTGTGGITELVRGRVFLPFTGSYAELQHVLTHELVHAFELDILMQGPGVGGSSPFGALPPLWVMEGLAEFLSQPIDDPHTDMWLRDGALSGYLVPPESMHLVGDIRVYRYGQAIFRSFARRWGIEKCGALLRAIRDHPGSFPDAFAAVTGMTWEAFSANWVTEVRRAHLPGIAAHAMPSEFARPLVVRSDTQASMLLVPSIAPDGERIAYVSDRGLTRDLYLRDLADDRSERLVRGDIDADFEALRFFNARASWSPDGRLLAFPAKRGGRDALYLFDVAERRVARRLELELDAVQTPSFSPDGQDLVFVGLEAGQSDLYRVRLDGSGLQRLTHDRNAVKDPQWSPDGRSVVYVTDAAADVEAGTLQHGRFRLELLDLKSGRRRDITPFERGKAVSPAWSGDAESIAFVSDRDGISNIYILHLPTGRVFRLTDIVTGISGILPTSPALSWSRESGRLVFTAFSNAGWDIYGIDDPERSMRPVEMTPGTVRPGDDRIAWAPARRTHATDVVSDAGPGQATTTAATSTAAPAVAADSAFVDKPYRSRFRPDLTNVGGVVGFQSGLGGQSLVNLSDLLGNQVWTLGLGIYGSLSDSDLLVRYTNRSGRINWSVSAFQVRRRSGFLADGSPQMSGQTHRGVRLTATRPRNTFSRLETSLQVANVTGRYGLDPTISADTVDPRARTFVSPGLAWVVDTALFGATGPILGKRMRLSVEAGFGELSYGTFEADVRRYWNLAQRYTIAARAYVGTSFGEQPQTFMLGGAHTLRGHAYGALVGSRAALLSAEFRFPLLQHLALGWPLPLELYNVRGSLFVDAASAWDGRWFRTSRAFTDRFVDRGPQVSYGLGGRINLGTFVLKVDWAWLFDPELRSTRAATNVAIGTDF